MTKYAFYLEEDKNETSVIVPPYLSEGQFFAKSIGILEPSAPPVKVHVISTGLSVRIDGNDGTFDANNVFFVPFQAQFKSDKKPQVLIVDLTPLKMIKGVAVTGLKFEQAHKLHVDSIYVNHGDNDWPIADVDDVYDRPVDKIMIHFKMPTNTKTGFFKFYVKMNVTGQTTAGSLTHDFECDPQVGNDPP
jgi:hypothetical protein